MIKTASFEGKLYAAPFNTNTQLLWYRKDLVTKPPKTWDEMIDEAGSWLEGSGHDRGPGQPYEGFTVWVNALIESAGSRSSPARKGRPRADADRRRRSRSWAGSPTPRPRRPSLATSDEDSARLGFEAGDSAFMVNYPFVYAERAGRSARRSARRWAARASRGSTPNLPSKPPLGGFNLGVGAYSKQQGRRLRGGRLPGQRRRTS